jgi:hypothetical protein
VRPPKRFFRVTAKGVTAVNRTQRALQSVSEGLGLIENYLCGILIGGAIVRTHRSAHRLSGNENLPNT